MLYLLRWVLLQPINVFAMYCSLLEMRRYCNHLQGMHWNPKTDIWWYLLRSFLRNVLKHNSDGMPYLLGWKVPFRNDLHGLLGSLLEMQ